ncbi:hypothetical protein DFS34DRAFT_612426 [Phlyctochytrium arcticum]|nr:hypothetical protein DFS34DRAFT_612426 [Phlyctochytrium arcticum]
MQSIEWRSKVSPHHCPLLIMILYNIAVKQYQDSVTINPPPGNRHLVLDFKGFSVIKRRVKNYVKAHASNPFIHTTLRDENASDDGPISSEEDIADSAEASTDTSTAPTVELLPPFPAVRDIAKQVFEAVWTSKFKDPKPRFVMLMELMTRLTKVLRYRHADAIERRWNSMKVERERLEASNQSTQETTKTPTAPPTTAADSLTYFALLSKTEQSQRTWTWASLWADAKTWFPDVYGDNTLVAFKNKVGRAADKLPTPETPQEVSPPVLLHSHSPSKIPRPTTSTVPTFAPTTASPAIHRPPPITPTAPSTTLPVIRRPLPITPTAPITAPSAVSPTDRQMSTRSANATNPLPPNPRRSQSSSPKRRKVNLTFIPDKCNHCRKGKRTCDGSSKKCEKRAKPTHVITKFFDAPSAGPSSGPSDEPPSGPSSVASAPSSAHQ